MNSRRHKERLAGKSLKVKFTPYNKLQPSTALAVRWITNIHTHTPTLLRSCEDQPVHKMKWLLIHGIHKHFIKAAPTTTSSVFGYRQNWPCRSTYTRLCQQGSSPPPSMQLPCALWHLDPWHYGCLQAPHPSSKALWSTPHSSGLLQDLCGPHMHLSSFLLTSNETQFIHMMTNGKVDLT